MADGDDSEPKYELYVQGSDKPREDGSQKFTGIGKALFVNGDTYEGTFVEGMRSGRGVYTFKKFGDTYEGQYEENRKHGFGTITYKSGGGGEDEEEAADDAAEGAAPRGGSYVGHYTMGLRGSAAAAAPPGEEAAAAAAAAAASESSEGTFTYVNGDSYCGQWQAGKKHGKGTYSFAKDGTRLEGHWEGGKITSGRWVFPNGTFYVGRFRYNKPFGKGIWVFANGNQLTGEYLQKEQAGEGEGGDEPEDGAPKPDPKVWCNFKHGKTTSVRGGSMFGPKIGA